MDKTLFTSTQKDEMKSAIRNWAFTGSVALTFEQILRTVFEHCQFAVGFGEETAVFVAEQLRTDPNICQKASGNGETVYSYSPGCNGVVNKAGR